MKWLVKDPLRRVPLSPPIRRPSSCKPGADTSNRIASTGENYLGASLRLLAGGSYPRLTAS